MNGQVMFTEKEQSAIRNVKNRMQDMFVSRMADLTDVLVYSLRQGAILTGGVSASLFHHEEPNDFDIYFIDSFWRDKFTQQLDMRHDLIADVNHNYTADTLVSGKCVTANATTLTNDFQIIGKQYSRQDFDFVHCMPYYDFLRNLYYISPEQYHSIMDRKLVQNPRVTPSKKRIQKFLERGWTQ